MDTSVYVHFPWCLAKCPYCDFASGAIRAAEVPHDAYADAVLRELEERAESLAGRHLVSVFFGGGTPSLWSAAALGRVLASIEAAFETRAPEVEVTVECNPSSLDEDRARAFVDVGVDRLSIGVQSLDDARLRFLGRLHDAAGARRAVSGAVKHVPRVSGDLMFGMPGQRADDFATELSELVDLGVEHVSAYALTIEPATQFGALHKKGKLQLAPEDGFAETFERARAELSARGFAHYEVSNHAREGAESRHNLHTWRGGDYLGLGAGAVGALSEGTRARRYRNDPRPERYLACGLGGGEPREIFEEHLEPSDRIGEALMLGLRTAEGVDLDVVRARTERDPLAGRERALERRVRQGDVTLDGARLRVPASRWLLLDSIVADLF
ncbi:MAG: radical SAM family heme chaperone HemW [Sandaracinaceae bacterium]